MIWAVSLLLLAVSPYAAPQTAANSQFNQIVHHADEARTSEHPREALELYREGVKLRPGWEDGWWWLGSMYYEQDRFPEAADAFRHFLALSPKNTPAYAFLGLCEYETGDYANAGRHLGHWVQAGAPGNEALKNVGSYHWALLLTRAGHYLPALTLLNNRVTGADVNAYTIEAMGLAALEIPKLPTEYAPEDREMVWLAGESWANLATIKINPHIHSQEFALRLVSHYGNRPKAHFVAGFTFERTGEDAKAIEEYKKELEISPKSVAALIRLAECDLRVGNVEEGKTMARGAVAAEPGNAIAHRALGQGLLDAGEIDQSVVELESAKRMAPENAGVRRLLATAYKKQGKTEEAHKEWEQFTALQKREADASLGPSEPAKKPGAKGGKQ